MESINIANARRDLFDLAEKAITSNVTIKITSPKGSVVMMSEDDYRALCETIYLYNIPGMVDSIISAAEAGDDEFIDADDIDWDV